MPITKSTGYMDSSGVMHATVEGAQRAELKALWVNAVDGNPDYNTEAHQELFAQMVFDSMDKLITILTTGPRSRPKARKASGTTNPKRAARGKGAAAPPPPPPATPEQAQAGFEAMREAAA